MAELITPIARLIVWLWPLKIYRLHDGERGVVRTFGKVRRWRWPRAERGPGLVFAMACEDVEITKALNIYLDIEEQEVFMSDGSLITFTAAATYDIESVQKAILECPNVNSLLSGKIMDRLRQAAQKVTWEELVSGDEVTKPVAGALNRTVRNRYGVVLHEVWLTDCRLAPVQLVCNVVREVCGIDD